MVNQSIACRVFLAGETFGRTEFPGFQPICMRCDNNGRYLKEIQSVFLRAESKTNMFLVFSLIIIYSLCNACILIFCEMQKQIH